MILLSCAMAMVAFLHLTSVNMLLNNLLGDTTQVDAQAKPGADRLSPKVSTVVPFPKSPINILRPLTLMEKPVRQLNWNCYDQLPQAVLMENNGNAVIMRISCSPYSMPYLSGSDLLDNFYFVEAVFKWGTSEHRIDSRSYALEMQVLHASNHLNGPFEYLTVCYLFVVSYKKNPQLEQVVENLCAIQTAGSMIELPPFDMASLMPSFDRGYYSYRGSYWNGSTVLPTQWFICTRILGISNGQLHQFQTLCGYDGNRVLLNARSEQPLGNRRVQFIK